MRCTEIREGCSALLDGEEAGLPRSAIDRHLRRCAACRAFVSRAEMPDLATMPDLAAIVVTEAEQQRVVRPFLASPVRIGLVAVAVAQLALAVPGLLGRDEGAPVHIAHEVGVWDFALAVGFLFAAWRPLRAVGMLPFVAALSAGLVLTAVVDIANGKQPALIETTHLLDLVGTTLLWMLTAPRIRRGLRIV